MASMDGDDRKAVHSNLNFITEQKNISGCSLEADGLQQQKTTSGHTLVRLKQNGDCSGSRLKQTGKFKPENSGPVMLILISAKATDPRLGRHHSTSPWTLPMDPAQLLLTQKQETGAHC